MCRETRFPKSRSRGLGDFKPGVAGSNEKDATQLLSRPSRYAVSSGPHAYRRDDAPIGHHQQFRRPHIPLLSPRRHGIPVSTVITAAPARAIFFPPITSFR